MIRRISLLLLLANATLVVAQPLYKWIEPDGSITFSPKQPPAGTAYETVNGEEAKTETITPAAQSRVKNSPATPATQETPAKLPRIEYAPDSHAAAISHSADLKANGTASPLQAVETAIAVSTGDSNEGVSAQASAARNKQSRCQDLRKRVVSLERRLKSRLTPEDMDNTVIHMARYQNNYDQYCVQ